jgi:hypothetical protein
MKPLLLVDVDGVLSLFSGPGEEAPIRPDTHFHNEHGMGHLIALDNCARLATLQDSYDLVWATGWEEKANDELLRIVGLPERLPVISFDKGKGKYDHQAHWKLGAIEDFIGDRPTAWLDDALDEACFEWATERTFPTLLVKVESRVGLDDEACRQLKDWAELTVRG